MASFKFEWKANRNFCLTAKHALDFDCEEADEARESGTYYEFALKLEHRDIPYNGFRVVGYYKTEKAALEAMVKEICYTTEYAFIWNREGECVDGAH